MKHKNETQRQNATSVRETIAELQPWFHNIHLPDGTQTFPAHPLGDFPAYKWNQIAPYLPADLSGWRVLEVGCNAGFYTVALAKRGAHVVGIDINEHYLRQACWIIAQHGLAHRIELRRQQIYELANDNEKFDLVFFMGVFYHLRYPLLGLDIVAQKVRRLMVFQTLMTPGEEICDNVYDLRLNDRARMCEPGWPKLAFVEHAFCKDPTNWWVANKAAALAMLRSSGMRPIAQIAPETVLCEPDPERPSCVTTWNSSEFLAATGRSWPRTSGQSKLDPINTQSHNGQQI